MLELVLKNVAAWTMWGALAAALATFLDFFVDAAELQGKTVFGGANIPEVIRFATQTIVGRLSLACLGLTLLVVLVSRLGGTPGKVRWWLTGVLAWGAIIVTGEVSHAAAQPGGSMVPVIAQVVHITAAALWMGTLIHIFLARGILLRDETGGPVAFVAGVVRKFSPLALATTSLLGITGLLAGWRYLQSVGSFFESPYGLALAVKLIILSPAIYAGFINFRYIRPALARLAGGNATSPETHGIFTRFSRTLELEVTAGILVIAVAGILGSISPPGEDGSQRLTAEQAHVFLQPHRPVTDTSGWALTDDPRGLPVAELRYDEFTHNWSGVMVCLMGLCWLLQSHGGRSAAWAWRIFPFLMILFGLFIDLAGNPDLLILKRYTLLHALGDPVLLEHQIGGLMVFILAWLTWRDRKTVVEKQPLGYPLPIIMIVGSLLLLGHAHSLTRIPDDLTNLINTQHAVFGALVLFAGTTRLLMLRGLVPARVARYVWPSFVISLGVFMAFFYREVV